jgi:hypothetical protein
MLVHQGEMPEPGMNPENGCPIARLGMKGMLLGLVPLLVPIFPVADMPAIAYTNCILLCWFGRW